MREDSGEEGIGSVGEGGLWKGGKWEAHGLMVEKGFEDDNR